MRVVKAAKDQHSGELLWTSSEREKETFGLAGQLEKYLSQHNGSIVDYVLQTLLPLLTVVINEMVAQKPDNPSNYLALWLMERAGTPAVLVSDFREWCRTGELPAKPPSVSRDEAGSPSPKAKKQGPKKGFGKTQSLRSANEHDDDRNQSFAVGSRASDSSSDRAPRSAMRGSGKASLPSEEPGSRSPQRSRAASCDEEEGRPSHTSDTGRCSDEGAAEGKASRRVSIWQEKEEEEVDAKSSSSSDDGEEHFENSDSKAAMMRLRGSMVVAQDPGEKASPMNNDRRRRFTVNISSTLIEPPPMQDTLRLLKGITFLKDFPEESLKKVVGIAKCRRYEPDEIIQPYGSKPRECFVVVDGRAKVAVPRVVGHVQVGEVFGCDTPQRANAINGTENQISAANEAVTMLSIDWGDVEKLNLKAHSKISRMNTNKRAKGRKSMGVTIVESLDGNTCPASGRPFVTGYQKMDADIHLISEALQANKVLCDVAQLTQEQMTRVGDLVYLVSVEAGETLMRQGDNGTCLFIVQEGMLVIKMGSGEFRFRAGDSFGELGLLYDSPRSATITAMGHCKLWVLTRADYKKVVRMDLNEKIGNYTDVISKIPGVASMIDVEHMDMIASVVEEMVILEGEEVCVEGEDTGFLFVVVDGECQTYKGGEFVRNLRSGEWIGEDQLTKNRPAEETVKVTTESARVLVLDSTSLQLVMKAVADMKKQQETKRPASKEDKRSASEEEGNQTIDYKAQLADSALKRKIDRYHRNRATITTGLPNAPDSSQTLDTPAGKAKKRGSATTAWDLQVGNMERMLSEQQMRYDIRRMKNLGILGEGSFGTVLLLEDDDKASTQYALKCLKKEAIKDEQTKQGVKNERTVQMLLNDSDFVVKLIGTYQDSEHMYFLLEPVLGGELFDVYNNNDLFGKLWHAKFYIASVSLALQHMHLKRVIYRDLKLENCLLDMTGNLKLTDMGIAKLCVGKTYTVCGTADYFAPETLRQTGHNRGADWWATGVLLFIMCSGRSPFDAPEVTQIYKNIMKGFSKVVFPDTFPSDLTDVIKSLCRKKPEDRVTMQKGGVENLKSMPFFTDLKWEVLAERKVPPPFVPPAAGAESFLKKESQRKVIIHYDELQEWDGHDHGT